ncbi:uncharacterized protein B0J16DRAFT_69292 [Fusarium flagelliforme]|uniref:uncharacterized protein n=1 Tax=Fusarium flagelliforme TaxID=2675880 RepID=UPI001E8CDBD4|nr:uncharacterized protein B0J16DRAFT_69292 [Fusarium flagelliforme]KAH7193017.1 hypothetical protein B0J16DRAFT_69292 [Fusarium flagelliforme]
MREAVFSFFISSYLFLCLLCPSCLDCPRSQLQLLWVRVSPPGFNNNKGFFAFTHNILIHSNPRLDSDLALGQTAILPTYCCSLWLV